MKILGLTGSIATGKSFVAEIFRQHNIMVFSSDKEVANLLKEQRVIDEIRSKPELAGSVKENLIDKHLLSNIAFNKVDSLKILEKILHPLVDEKRKEFIDNNKDEKVILLEIPLLFEKKYQNFCNKVITTYCSEKTQKERALRRKNIDNNRLNFIMKQQFSSNIKARLTDYLVYTEISYEYTKNQIEKILLKEGIK